MIDRSNVVLKAEHRSDGRWYITSATIPGFRYLLDRDDIMNEALTVMADLADGVVVGKEGK